MVNLPRLYENGAFSKILHPIHVTITQNIIPLDSATLTLLRGEELPPRSYVELFTPYGSAGMFRVRNPHDAYGQDTTTAEVEHMIAEVGDYVIKEEISEMIRADRALLKVFRYYEGGLWQLGSYSGLGTDNIALEAKYDRVLDTILGIMEQVPDSMMTFDFSTKPWTFNIVKRGTSVTAEGRLARNISSATVTYDDTELCTRVWYQTFDSNKNATWVRKDADTISKYGIVEGKISTSSDMTSTEITTTVDTYLSEHKKPRFSVSIQADELSQITGESMDKFTIGKLMRLNLVDYGEYFEDHITSITWSDVYGSRSVTVNLGEEEDTVVTFLHNLDSTGSGGGGGGKAAAKEEEQWKEYYTEWEKKDEYIAGIAVKQDRQGNILEQAGLTLNSKGVLIYAKTSNGLLHQFDILSDSFTSKIENTKAGLESAIEQTDSNIRAYVKSTKEGLESSINIQKDRIDLAVTRIGGAESRLSVAEGNISAVVSRVGGAESRLDIAEDSISTKVSKDGVISSINQTAETIKIQASKINLEGYVTSSSLSSQIADLTSVTMNSANVIGTLYIRNAGGSQQNVANAIWDIQLSSSGNTYTLSRKRINDSDYVDIGTFSRAVSSWTMGWANGKFTATANPQNQSCYTTIVQGTGSRSGTTVSIPIEATDSDNPSYQYATGRTVTYTLTSHSNCAQGLARYNNSTDGKVTLYVKSGSSYLSVGSHFWYWRDTNQNLTTYYT